MNKSLKKLQIFLLACILALCHAVSVHATGTEGDPVLSLSISRDTRNVVTLQWNAVEDAVSYNIYDTPAGEAQVKVNQEPQSGTSCRLDNLATNKVHTFVVKAVDVEGTEILSSAEKKVGITEKPDISGGVTSLNNKKAGLKLPVSDFVTAMDYQGPSVRIDERGLPVQDDQYHYWCYSSITDEKGLYHLFMSRVPRDTKFIPGWKTTSEIVHFVGKGPEGPFTEVGTPFAPGTLPDGQMSAHNPRIKKIGDKYVLLYIVRYDYVVGPPSKEGKQVTYMATIDELPTEPGSDTIDQWDLVADVDNPDNVNGVVLRYGVKAVNPDLVRTVDADGQEEYILYFKGNNNPDTESQPYRLYYAVSPNLEGPYTFVGKVTDANTTIEDPSIFEWKGKYFMLTYDLGNGISGAGASVGMLIPSRDPKLFSFKNAWITAGLLDDYVKTPAGSTHAYSGQTRMERPYLVFENGQPAYFVGTNSMDVNGNNVTQSYTFKLDNLPKHKVSVGSKIRYGTVAIENGGSEGEIFDDIYVTVSPEEGYVLVPDSVTVSSKDAMGRDCLTTAEKLEDGRYRFMMPSGDAVVSAKFRKKGMVDAVRITPNTATAVKGKSLQFQAAVEGDYGIDEGVSWSVEGADVETSIAQDGKLTVSSEESHKVIRVKATSLEDPSQYAAAAVYVEEGNLALGLPEENYTASSWFDNKAQNRCYPKNAFDGVNTFTGLPKLWVPATAGDHISWLQVDFGKAVTLNTLRLYDYGQANGSQLTGATVQVSEDGNEWKDVESFTFKGTEPVKECALSQEIETQYLRIGDLITTDPSKTLHFIEMEVYNIPDDSVPENPESTLKILTDPGKTYDGRAAEKPAVATTGSSGDVKFRWYRKTDGGWEALYAAPIHAGSYKVAVELEEDLRYPGCSAEREFTIAKAGSTLSIDGSLDKTYDGFAVRAPQVTRSGSSGSVSFTWYKNEGGNWKPLPDAPVAAGSYKVAASLPEDEDHNGAAAEKQFTISGGEDQQAAIKEAEEKAAAAEEARKQAEAAQKAAAANSAEMKAAWEKAKAEAKKAEQEAIRLAETVIGRPEAKPSNGAYNKITLTWDRQEGTDGYEISRSTSKNGSYKTVSTVTGGSKTKYTDGKLDCGKTYYYKVRAYKDTSLGRLYGKESKAVKLKAAPAQAVIAKASAGKGTATIKAKKQGGVDGYEFSRSLKKKGGFKKIKSGKSPGMKDSKLNAKKTYYYRVRTYKIVKGKKVYGAYSNVKAVQVKK